MCRKNLPTAKDRNLDALMEDAVSLTAELVPHPLALPSRWGSSIAPQAPSPSLTSLYPLPLQSISNPRCHRQTFFDRLFPSPQERQLKDLLATNDEDCDGDELPTCGQRTARLEPARCPPPANP